MTHAQMKKGLNAELKAAGFLNLITKVSEVEPNTCLRFFAPLNHELKQWLNNRFKYGIFDTNTDHSIVFIKTPKD